MIESIRETVPVRDPDTDELVGEVERFTLKRDFEGRTLTCMQDFPPAAVEDFGAESCWLIVAEAWCDNLSAAITAEAVRNEVRR